MPTATGTPPRTRPSGCCRDDTGGRRLGLRAHTCSRLGPPVANLCKHLADVCRGCCWCLTSASHITSSFCLCITRLCSVTTRAGAVSVSAHACAAATTKARPLSRSRRLVSSCQRATYICRSCCGYCWRVVSTMNTGTAQHVCTVFCLFLHTMTSTRAYVMFCSTCMCLPLNGAFTVLCQPFNGALTVLCQQQLMTW